MHLVLASEGAGAVGEGGGLSAVDHAFATEQAPFGASNITQEKNKHHCRRYRRRSSRLRQAPLARQEELLEWKLEQLWERKWEHGLEG